MKYLNSGKVLPHRAAIGPTEKLHEPCKNWASMLFKTVICVMVLCITSPNLKAIHVLVYQIPKEFPPPSLLQSAAPGLLGNNFIAMCFVLMCINTSNFKVIFVILKEVVKIKITRQKSITQEQYVTFLIMFN